MKKTKRSAFTIVELVIVIAVIAILSAVLIPTFGAIIKDANVTADRTAANTLTTELHLELKGDQITTEEELVTALAASGISSKLNPKSEQYGYHYWFDMENQMIVAERSDIVAAKATQIDGGENTYAPSGAALMSAVLTNDVTSDSSVNISFRDIYGIGWYLIDDDTTLGNVIKTLTDKTTGLKDFQDALVILNTFEIEDDLCGKIVATVNSTIIVTNNGTFYPENATNVSFAAGVTSITNTQYSVTTDSTSTSVSSETAPTDALPLASGNVVIPDTVTCIEDNSFNFATGSTVNVEVSEDKLNTFCPNSTNVTINTTLEIKVNQEGTSQIVDTSDNDKVIVEELVSSEGRFPGFSFDILKSNAEDNTYAWNNNTLYVYYNAFKNLGNKLELALTTDGTNPVDDTKGFVKWTCTGGANVGTITDNGSTVYNILGATADGTVTGEVTLRDGTKASKSFDVVMVKPTAATVSIGEKAIGLGTGGVQAPSFEWGYDGTNGTRTISFNVTGYSHQIANGASNISVTVDSEAFTYDATTKKLTLKTKGGNGDDAINLKKDGEVEITLSVDGLLETTVKVTLRDYTKAEFASNYHYTASADRPYYIGNGQITLGNILKLKADELTYDSYKVSVEVPFNGAYQKVDDIDGWSAAYDETFAKGSWDDAKINISTGTNNTPIRVKITPDVKIDADTAASDEYTVAINLTYVNGTNVLDAAGLLAAANADTSTNVVIMKDITLADAHNSSNYSLNFTTGETLYGNGFIVNATKYVSAAETHVEEIYTTYTTYCTECKSAICAWTILHAKYYKTNYTLKTGETTHNHFDSDGALINLTGGIVNNVYINGPVYPTLQYAIDDCSATGYDHASTKYYVSGIKATGTSSVINSYVSGFRQPVKVDGATLNLTNSTLYGGNYANLQLIKGTINLHDVTTVQPLDGVADTFGEGKNVIGLGIAVEKDAVDGTTSAINVSGYLDQYNWVSSDAIREADLPIVTIDGTQIKLDVVLAALFNGLRVDFAGTEIERPLNFLENYYQKETDANGNVVKKYLNTGIMLMAFAPTSDGIAEGVRDNAGKLTVVDRSRTAGELSGTKFTPQGSIPLFSEYNPIEQISFLTADQLMLLLEDFTINETDGWAEGEVNADIVAGLFNPLDVYIKIWSYGNSTLPENVNIFAEGYNINYGGYTYK